MDATTTLLLPLYIASAFFCLRRVIKESIIEGYVKTPGLFMGLLPFINLLYLATDWKYHQRVYSGEIEKNLIYRERVMVEVVMMARRRELSIDWLSALVERVQAKEGVTFQFGPNLLKKNNIPVFAQQMGVCPREAAFGLLPPATTQPSSPNVVLEKVGKDIDGAPVYEFKGEPPEIHIPAFLRKEKPRKERPEQEPFFEFEDGKRPGMGYDFRGTGA
jgi:hypothetical protein